MAIIIQFPKSKAPRIPDPYGDTLVDPRCKTYRKVRAAADRLHAAIVELDRRNVALAPSLGDIVTNLSAATFDFLALDAWVRSCDMYRERQATHKGGRFA